MVYDTANKLAQELRLSAEYTEYENAKEQVAGNDATRTLIDEYHRLQIQAQAALASGRKDDEAMQKLQKIGELLQFDAAAANYLMAEFRLNRMMADIYKTLAEAVGIDLSMLEN